MTQSIFSVSPVIVPRLSSPDQSAKHQFHVLRTHAKTRAFAVIQTTFSVLLVIVPSLEAARISPVQSAKHHFSVLTTRAKIQAFATNLMIS